MKTAPKLTDSDNSMVIKRGKWEWGEVEEGKGETNGDVRRQLWAVNTKYKILMMCYRIVNLKPA